MKAGLLLLLLFAISVHRACACETVLTSAEIAANRARAVAFVGPTPEAQFGTFVNAVGDVNGDGFDDFALAAPHESTWPGAVYIIFGRISSAWESAQFDFNVTDTPDPASWIRISGSGQMFLGYFGVAHGDFNGDGLGDFLLGSNTGTVFCVYGDDHDGGNWSSFSTTDVESGVVPGFILTGGAKNVGNAGDMNGDGIDDMLLIPNTINASVAYVVFGLEGATRGAFDLSTIDGTNGFLVSDDTDNFGNEGVKESAGDVNGDGLADLAISSASANSNTGRAYVLFARNVSATGQQWPATLNLTTDLDGTNGFAIEGPASNKFLGFTITGAGDVNSDGFEDIFIGSYWGAGGVWIVFGRSAPWATPFNVSQLDGTNGFHFAPSPNDAWGWSGGSAGDVNGDGFDDIIVGGRGAADSFGIRTGASALIFGHNGTWPAELHYFEVVGSVGFLVDGPFNNTNFGVTAHGAGDVNGDGLADFVVGAPFYLPNTGYAALVFGMPEDHCAVCSNFSDACIVCDDGFVLNSTFCEIEVPDSSSQLSTFSSHSSKFSSSSFSSHHLQISSSSMQVIRVVVVITFLDDVDVSDPTELKQEIANILSIPATMISIAVISPTEVEVTIIGSEEAAQRLVEIVDYCKGQ